jgi:hypothetical protein
MRIKFALFLRMTTTLSPFAIRMMKDDTNDAVPSMGIE